MRLLLTPLFLLLSLLSVAQPQDHHVYLLGHSLVNFTMPEMLNDLADDAGFDHQYDLTVGNGANLQWQWQSPQSAQGTPYTTVLPAGNNDIAIVTEAVPLVPHLQWSATYAYADSFYTMANQYRPDIKFFVYETWHCIDSGTPQGCDWDNESNIAWRTRLDIDLPRWQSIVDTINAHHPNANAQLVPAGQAMGALYDAIAAGSVPTLTSIDELFSDNIHLTEVGNYFIACVMYASIYQQSPEGLTNQTTNIWGGNFATVPPDLANRMQEIAWTTVCNYFGWASCCANAPTPTISGQDSACSNNIYTYTTPNTSGHTYTWTVAGGSILSGQGTNTVTVQWNNTGTAWISVSEQN